MKLARKYLGLYLLLISSAAFGQKINVIELKHRSAEELIPTIAPLLSADEGVSGQGYQIILKANTGSLENIKRLIQQLDKPAAQLLISIRNMTAEQANTGNRSITAKLPKNSFSITTGKRENQGLGIHTNTSDNRQTERQDQQIRASEGKPALINSGIDAPLNIKRRQRINGQIIEQNITEFHPVQRGFYVTAWLNGDRVRLEIQQQNQSLQNNGAISSAKINTTVSGELGKWISIGGLATTEQYRHHKPNSQTSISTQNRNQIYIKVEKLSQ